MKIARQYQIFYLINTFLLHIKKKVLNLLIVKEDKKMKIRNIYLITTMLLTLSSCSQLEKVLKNRDYNGMYKIALDYYANNKDSKAIAVFESVESVLSSTDKADTIAFLKAKAYFRKNEFDISSTLFNEFRNKYTKSPFIEEAEYLFAMSFYEAAPITELDQSYSTLAINAFVEFINRYPQSPKVESCGEMISDLQRRIYDKSFIIAQTYYNMGTYNSAITAFKNVLRQYPDIPQKEQVVFMLLKSNFMYAKGSVEQKQRERFYNTIDAYHSFIDEFPDSEYKNDAERIFNYAQKYAKGEKMISEMGEELNLSDKKKKSNERKMNKNIERVDKGKLSEEQLNKDMEDQLVREKEKRESREVKREIKERTEKASSVDREKETEKKEPKQKKAKTEKITEIE